MLVMGATLTHVPAVVLLSGAVLLTLAGCGSEPAGKAQATATVTVTETVTPSGGSSDGNPGDNSAASGQYSFEYMGATGTLAVPASPKDPRVEEIEQYRRSARAAEVSYVLAEVDNTQGRGDINMYGVTVVTGGGQQIEFVGVSELIGDWQENFKGVAGYNRGVDLYNKYQFFLKPGAKGTAILAAKNSLDDPARVFVYPAGGFEDVEAVPSTG